MITLVTGATRSGKSEWAEHLVMRSQKDVIYIATAARYADDAEWEARIQKHCDRRPESWQIREVPIELSKSILEIKCDLSCYVLVDSLGTWLANLLEQSEDAWIRTENELLQTIQDCEMDVIFVSEEVGWGIVPAYELGRTFRDRLGGLSRKIGAIADVVYLVAGGYAIDLTQVGKKLPS